MFELTYILGGGITATEHFECETKARERASGVIRGGISSSVSIKRQPDITDITVTLTRLEADVLASLLWQGTCLSDPAKQNDSEADHSRVLGNAVGSALSKLKDAGAYCSRYMVGQNSQTGWPYLYR